MLLAVLLSALFVSRTFAGAAALGSVSGWFPVTSTFEAEQFLGKRLVFRAMDVPWTIDKATLRSAGSEVANILSVNAVPVINWDPLMSNTYKDTLQAIEDGLHDNIIETFFGFLKDTLNTSYAILFFGTTCNSNGVYWSEDPDLYIRVYKKLHIKAKEKEVGDNVIWGWSLDISKFAPIEGNAYVLNTTGLTHLPSAYFPGESYIGWIGLQVLNNDVNNWVNPSVPIRVGIGVASSLAPGKPVMLIGGTSSQAADANGNVSSDLNSKNRWFEEFVETAYVHLDRTEESSSTIRAIMLYNRESSLDTGFYDSINGDTITSISNNGVELYSYSVLETLFTEERIVAPTGEQPEIREVDSIVAFGAICGPGEKGVASSGNCAPCEAGSYSNKTGSSTCELCPVGMYNEDVGQTECTPCPANKTTAHTGSKLEEYCECAPGFVLKNTENIDAGCIQCQRNSFSKGGASACQACPKFNRWPTGKSGVGCYCKYGAWDHKTEMCTDVASSTARRYLMLVSTIVSIAIAGVVLIHE